MSDHEAARPHQVARSLPSWLQLVFVLVVFCIGGGAFFLSRARSASEISRVPEPVVKTNRPFVPTASQLATFTIQPVQEMSFQVENTTEGKISVDEDRATPIFSPYGGRVIRLLAKAGDLVTKGQVLFTIEATDMVQAQNDLIAANGAVNKARSQLQLAQTIEKRQRELNDARAVALKELQNAQNDLVSALNDLRAAESGYEAVKNRLRILGKTDADVTAFLQNGQMSPETPIQTPLTGTITQRRIGPGQYISTSATDPAFTVGDLSSVWLIASVREFEAPKVTVGQSVKFRVLAFPDRTFAAKVTYVAASVEPATRRVLVRAQIDNTAGLLKPEMYASVRIATGDGEKSAGVPREAVIYEADKARVWVIAGDGSVSLRQVTTGIVNGTNLQIKSGLAVGERVVTRGSLFIDRLASGDTQ